MDIAQVIVVMTIIVSNMAGVLFLYFKSDQKSEEIRNQTNQILESNRKESSEILRGIALEMKDFHGRLVSIEERNKKA